MSNLSDNASRQLRVKIQEIECEIVRKIVATPDWLDSEQATDLRWALSLARITKVKVNNENKIHTVRIDHASDNYRAQIFATLSYAISNTGLINKEKIIELTPKLKQIAKKERLDLLSLFSNVLPKKALDDATRRRPLALTLSGGGGTSYVFVGAFHALQESGITPSVIAGSSMGAILGAYRAKTRDFSLDDLDELVSKTSWRKIAQPYSGPSRFGVPGAFRLYLRDVVGHEFDRNGQFARLADLKIPLRVCVAGLSSTNPPPESELNKYAHALDASESIKKRSKNKSIISTIMDFAQKPLKNIYLGGDDLTKEFDVLDAIGFSAAIPGVFHYDIMRNDPRMINLVNQLFVREGVIRLIDGGFVDNLPAKEAIRAVDNGDCDGFDPFVLSLDGFSPGLNRHLLFYPLMRYAVEHSREGHKLSHLSVVFKEVLSPIHIVPTKETLKYAIKHGHKEFSPHLPFIRKMIGPIPDPRWIHD